MTHKCYSGLCQLYLCGRQVLALILFEVYLKYRVDEKYNCTWCSCLTVLCLLPDGFLRCHFPTQGLCLRSSAMVWLCTACYVFAVSFFFDSWPSSSYLGTTDDRSFIFSHLLTHGVLCYPNYCIAYRSEDRKEKDWEVPKSIYNDA